MRHLRLSLASVVLLVLGACTPKPSEPPPQQPPDPSQAPVAAAARYIAGSNLVVVGESVATNTGASVEGAVGSAAEGLLVEVDAPAGTHVTLLQEDGRLEALTDGSFVASFTLRVGDGGTVYPVRFRLPFDRLTNARDLYELSPDGVLHPTSVTVDAGTATFAAQSDARFLLVQLPSAPPSRDADPPAPLPEEINIRTPFIAAKHGFAIANQRTRYMGGACLGMSAFALWYYQRGGALFSEFSGSVSTETGGGEMDLALVLASRAQSGVSRRQASYSRGGILGDTAEATLSQLRLIAASLQNTAMPVLLKIDSATASHAVLVLGVMDGYLSYYLPLYDPNVPGSEPMMFVSYAGKPEYGDYTWLERLGTRTLPTAEPFADMVRDAQASFHGENEHKIDVTSHQSGQKVDRFKVTLEGELHSGQLLIGTMKVVNKSDHDREFEVSVSPTNPHWSVEVELLSGTNNLRFATEGYAYSDVPVEAKNTYSEKDFVLVVEAGYVGTIHVNEDINGAIFMTAVMDDFLLKQQDPYDWEQKQVPVNALLTLSGTTCASVSEKPDLLLNVVADSMTYTLSFGGLLFDCSPMLAMPGFATSPQPYTDLGHLQGSYDHSSYGITRHIEWNLMYQGAD